MRALTSAADRAAALLILVIVAALAAVVLTSCAAPRCPPAVYPMPPVPRAVDLATCPRIAVWVVAPAYRFRGVDYPADSTLARDSVVELSRCRS